MRTKIIEGVTPDHLYLKAMVGRFEPHEWERPSLVTYAALGEHVSLLDAEGWGPKHFMILDLSNPGPGGIFKMAGHAGHDMRKLDRVLARY